MDEGYAPAEQLAAYGAALAHAHRGVAAQVEIEATFESGLSYPGLKCIVPGTFNAGFAGSTCTAQPR